MSKKKVLKKKAVVSDLTKLSFSDLHAMYMFVNNLNNATFGKKVQAKALFRAKLADVETELYSRLFGMNPFGAESEGVIPKAMTDIKGVDPIKVISSFESGADTNNKTFVVAKNDERK